MDAVVIGMGSAGKRHTKNLMALGQKIVAVADPAWEDQMTKSGIRSFQNPLNCLEEEANDRLVVIASPTAFHYEQVMKAIDNGAAAILVEKPMAVNADQAWKMWRDAETMGVRAAVGFNYRFMIGAVKLVADPIRRGERPVIFQSMAMDDITKWPSYHSESHFLDPRSGGVLLTSTSHEIDMAVGMLGRPSSTMAILDRNDDGLDTASTLIIGFDGEHRATSAVRWETGREPYMLWSTHGGVSFTFADVLSDGWKSDRDTMHYRMLKAFVEYDVTDQGLLCSFEQGYWGMAVIDAARKSAASNGTPVELTLQVAI